MTEGFSETPFLSLYETEIGSTILNSRRKRGNKAEK